MARIYDSGDIVIYHLGEVDYAGSQADIAVTAAVAALACGAAAAGAPGAVTVVLGVALFAMPGYLLAQLLLGPATAGLERALVAVGLAFIVPIVAGLVLYTAGVPLRRASWLARARRGDPGLRCGPALAPPDLPGPTLSLATGNPAVAALACCGVRCRGRDRRLRGGPCPCGRGHPAAAPFHPAVAVDPGRERGHDQNSASRMMKATRRVTGWC